MVRCEPSFRGHKSCCTTKVLWEHCPDLFLELQRFVGA
jgi:hypothetical protein